MATHPSSNTERRPEQEIDTLAEKAERCRRLARGISDRQAADVLQHMAENYERSAARLKQRTD